VEDLVRLRRLQATPATAIRGFFFNRMFLDRLFVIAFGALVLLLALLLGSLSATEPALLAAVAVSPLMGVAAVILRFKRRSWNPLLKWMIPAVLVGCCVGAPLAVGGGTLRGTFLVGWACLVTSVSLLIMPLTKNIDLGSHLQQVAERVGALMKVPIVIFGHHHRCVDRTWGGGRYLNTGAWVNTGMEGNHAHVALIRTEEGALSATLKRGRTYLVTGGAK